jgi:hypothetical protein
MGMSGGKQDLSNQLPYVQYVRSGDGRLSGEQELP